MQVNFIVPGEPRGKARARTFFDARARRVVSKTPENTAVYENLVKLCYQNATQGHRFSDGTPLRVSIRAYFSIAKSTAKKRLPGMLAGLIRPTRKPDIDNITKIVLDAINGIAYKDDAAIVQISAAKFFSEDPRLEVTIGEWEGPQNG